MRTSVAGDFRNRKSGVRNQPARAELGGRSPLSAVWNHTQLRADLGEQVKMSRVTRSGCVQEGLGHSLGENGTVRILAG